MKTNLLRTGIFSALMIGSGYAFAQDQVYASAEKVEKVVDGFTVTPEEEKKKEDEPTFKFSGSIDTYARTALGYTNPSAFGASAPSTSFANLKGFGLGMMNLIASYGGEKSGFTADLVFGPRGRDAVFGDGAYYAGSSQRIINQMFAYYKISDKVTFNLGQFNTFLGYEVISPTVNFHYSTSYLFSWGPFNHTGFRADFDLGDGFVGKLAVMNPTDIVEFNSVNTYTIGGQLGKTTEAGGIWLNALYGDQDGTLDKVDYNEDGFSYGSLLQLDLTGGYNLTEKFYLGFNTSMQSVAAGQTLNDTGEVVDSDGDATSFFGVALYPKVTLSETFALGLRAEYFGVRKNHLGIFGLDSNGDGSVTAFTLSGNYKVGGLTLIPELRLDSTSEDSFLDSDLAPQKSMTSLALAAVYKF